MTFASQKWSASASADPLNESCRGYLFKLKENKKDWKKLFVVLHGADIIYYDNPHCAQTDQRSKDGTKSVLSAMAYEEFSRADGVSAPTSTPSYMLVETTHAKKIYCAKSADERQMWISNIKMNVERVAKAGVVRERSGSSGGDAKKRDEPAGGFFSRLFNNKRDSSVAGMSPRSRFSMETHRLASTRVSGAARSSQAEKSSAASHLDDVALDDALKQMLATLGLADAQAQNVLKLPAVQKREMLRGFELKQGSDIKPKKYVSVLLDDPGLEELGETAAWLSTAPIKNIDEFVKSGGTDALGGPLRGRLENPDPSPGSNPSSYPDSTFLYPGLCAHAAEIEGSHYVAQRIEATMRCLKNLTKVEVGLNAVINSPANVCQSFASSGKRNPISEPKANPNPSPRMSARWVVNSHTPNPDLCSYPTTSHQIGPPP